MAHPTPVCHIRGTTLVTQPATGGPWDPVWGYLVEVACPADRVKVRPSKCTTDTAAKYLAAN